MEKKDVTEYLDPNRSDIESSKMGILATLYEDDIVFDNFEKPKRNIPKKEKALMMFFNLMSLYGIKKEYFDKRVKLGIGIYNLGWTKKAAEKFYNWDFHKDAKKYVDKFYSVDWTLNLEPTFVDDLETNKFEKI